MTIDIVTYTDEQYAAMTQEQLKEVRDAQTEKDELKIELEDTLKAKRAALVKKGIFNSDLYQLIKTKLEKEYEARVEFIRECLLFFLQYSKDPNGAGIEAPYEVNYAQSYDARVQVLRAYYETTYSDPNERFEAFKLDKFALTYLGNRYRALHEYFRSFTL